MADLFATFGAAAGIFAGTDIDDIIVLIVLFLASRAPARREVGRFG